MHRHFACWVATALLMAAPTAAAQPEPGEPAPEPAPEAEPSGGEELGRNDAAMEAMEGEEAKSHFRIGGTLYNEGRFNEAAEEFRKAYELSGKPALLFNMYIAYRDAGRTEQAVEALRSYLDQAEAVPDRRQLRTRLEAMEETLASRGSEPAGASEDRAESAPGGGAEPSAVADAGGPPEPEEDGGSALPWVIAGTGAAMIVAASMTGIIALNKTANIEDACGDDNVCPPDFPLEQEREETRRWVRATDVLWPIGAAALGTGLLLFFLMDDDGDAPVEAAAGCTGRGCAGEVRVRF